MNCRACYWWVSRLLKGWWSSAWWCSALPLILKACFLRFGQQSRDKRPPPRACRPCFTCYGRIQRTHKSPDFVRQWMPTEIAPAPWYRYRLHTLIPIQIAHPDTDCTSWYRYWLHTLIQIAHPENDCTPWLHTLIQIQIAPAPWYRESCNGTINLKHTKPRYQITLLLC
jgi:hypothetical protein